MKRGDAKRQADRRRVLVAVAVGVAVVLLVVLIAVLSSGEAGSSPTLDELAGDPVIEGESYVPLGDPADDPVVGTPAPVVTGADFDGGEVTIGAPGRPQMLMFLASWCPACQQELPAVVSWMDAGGLPDGVDLIAVSTGLDPRRPEWPPDAWLEREGWTGPVLVDDADGSVAGAFGLTGTPFWVILDAQGRAVARVSGMVDTAILGQLAASLVE